MTQPSTACGSASSAPVASVPSCRRPRPRRPRDRRRRRRVRRLPRPHRRPAARRTRSQADRRRPRPATCCCSPSPTTCSPTSSRCSARAARSARASTSCTPPAATASPSSSRPPPSVPASIALHPAMTFTGTDVDLAAARGLRLRRHRRRRRARRSPRRSSPTSAAAPMWVPEDRRTLYHAGLAHGANHLVTLVAAGDGDARRAGVDDPRPPTPCARCSPPPSTTRSRRATPRSPARSCAATSSTVARPPRRHRARPRPHTLAVVRRDGPRDRSTASSPTAGCCRSGPPSWPRILDAAEARPRRPARRVRRRPRSTRR